MNTRGINELLTYPHHRGDFSDLVDVLIPCTTKRKSLYLFFSICRKFSFFFVFFTILRKRNILNKFPNSKNVVAFVLFKHLTYIFICCKILLIHSGRIYGQRPYIREKNEKHFNFNLLNLLLFFLFSSLKLVFWHISHRARCKICSKLTIKAPDYVKSTINLTIKTPLTSFCSLYC